MNPYRSAPLPETPHKPRTKFRTFQLKLAIWWLGPWKDRFIRNPLCRCAISRFGDRTDDRIDLDLDWYVYLHSVRCKKYIALSKEKEIPVMTPPPEPILFY